MAQHRYVKQHIEQYTGWPKKSEPLPNKQKIVLKLVNEIRFIRQIKVWIKHNNIIRWH